MKIQIRRNVIHITMYLHPVIFDDLEKVVANVNYNPRTNKWQSDNNQTREINGPLSEYGEELENPIKWEYDHFIRDCKWLIKECGFTIIAEETSTDSKKSEYVVVFGMDDDPCGTLVYEIRLSDHPFDAKFPERLKDAALQYLTVNKILDGTAEKAGIDFTVEKVTVGSVKHDTWDKALNRLDAVLMKMRKAVRKRLKMRNNSM